MRDVIAVLGADVLSGRAVAKKLRKEQYCCALLSSGTPPETVAQLAPAGIILAGEAQEGAAPPDAGLLALGIPVLSLGSSTRSLLEKLGTRRDADAVESAVMPVMYKESPLFAEIGAGERWIAYAEPYAMQEPYTVIAEGDQFPLAFANCAENIYLLQFQIERNDPDGMSMLLSFADAVCGCTPWWTPENIMADAEQVIRDAAGDGEVVCAISGGLDSTVAALLSQRALGDRTRCVFIDTGLFRRGEAEAAERYCREELHLNFTRIDAGQSILSALKGLTVAHEKWCIINEAITQTLAAAAHGASALVMGTHYVDALRMGDRGHNDRYPTLIEPLCGLFKDEIRIIGEHLSLSAALLTRQPFPDMGLAARVYGEVTADRLEILRTADAIFCETLTESGQDKRLIRYYAELEQLDDRDAIILRAALGTESKLSAARLPHDLLERATEKILKELPSVGRVLYDMTPGSAG